MKKLTQGVLVAIEGVDGSGKSTLARRLHKSLAACDLPVVLTREPGGTEFGNHIRTLVHNATIERTAKSEFLLFAADRAEHSATIVGPALERAELVISDRMADSSAVYQGYAQGLDEATIAMINAWAMNFRGPDIVVYVRVPAQCAYERIVARRAPLTYFERHSAAYLQKLVEGFDALVAQKPGTLVLDGTRSCEHVAERAHEYVTTWLSSHDVVDQEDVRV